MKSSRVPNFFLVSSAIASRSISACAVLIAALLTLVSTAQAALQIPTNLSESDRITALKIVGLGTGSKILSEPYPLGGYSGFELGLSLESLPVDDLARLGDGLSSPQQDVVYPKLTFGKGLYNDVDVFLHFTPFRRQDEISLYGAMVRWGFYQGQYLPVSASLVIHANAGNFGNILTATTYGADLIGGITVNQVSLFAGLGIMQANGTYTGGANSVTGGQETKETVEGLHTVIGANLRFFDPVFLTLEIDRTEVAVISGKLGLRF